MTLKEQLEKAVASNKETCARILAGHFQEPDAVYMPELPGEKVLSDREIYIYHKAWANAVEAVLSMVSFGNEPDENLLDQLLHPAE